MKGLLEGSGLLGALVALVVTITPLGARADDAPTGTTIDWVAARFSSPETGGPEKPRFVFARTLAFEARLEAMTEGPGIGEGYQEHDIRTALEHDVAEQMLASLAEKLIVESPADKRPGLDEIPRVEQMLSAAITERLGGRARIDDAARAEQLDPTEVDALLHRAALAAWYLDRAMTPVLHATDVQLREVYRASAHPYRGRPYDTIRDDLARWFALERIRVTESAFLQSARSRVKLSAIP